MAFCRKCGSVIDDEAVVCPKCGVAQHQMTQNQRDVSGGSRNTNGIALLGIFFPFIGWIVYIIMMAADSSDLRARDLLSGNIFGTIVYAIIIFLVNRG